MQKIEKISDNVRQYLWDNIGNTVGPGMPRFDERTRTWSVPVLCDTERGIFAIGEICLDEQLNFLRLPSKSELEKTAQQILEAVPVLVYATPEKLREKGFVPVTP